MEEIFVTKLRINKVRHLENLIIPLSETERKHLILTGKNGSGKTSVLEGIIVIVSNLIEKKVTLPDLKELQRRFEGHIPILISQKQSVENAEKSGNGYEIRGQKMHLSNVQNSYERVLDEIIKLAPCNLDIYPSVDRFSYELENNYKPFIFKIFEAKRIFSPKESRGPQKIDLKNKYNVNENANENFVRQLVNLRLDLLDAKDVGKIHEADKIEEWFKKFTKILKEVFEDDTLQLVFDRPSFNYNIITKINEAFNLNQLSDGYSAFLSIVTELIMRISGTEFTIRPYDAQGLVIIDEVENHLHISLQKKILPFLTSFFPKIQFIVTTHSPFVLSSVDNTVIYDLEKQQVVEDLSDYSYQELVETYFGTDQYSHIVKQKLDEYEILIKKEGRTEEEEDKLYELRKYFRKLPFFLSPELQLKIQELELYKLPEQTL